MYYAMFAQIAYRWNKLLEQSASLFLFKFGLRGNVAE